ncbi:MAG TPA: serine/threonine-protein kinase, partial [Longimicrobiales bacterium]
MSGSEPLIPPLEGTLPGTQPGAPASGAPAAAPDELIGRELSGRYRIVQKLGEGAMGAVYIGEHVRMGRRDAIKVLRGPLAGDAEAVRRFNRGARNISAVHHPNVCTIYDFSDTAEGVTFLAMELITGESLRELLEREGALPPERAVSIARQVADALQAAHDAGIVHRDLKPANIMITRGRDGGDVVKVVDFDIAKAYDEAEGPEVTRVGFVVGTPEYMSPEQLIGERLDGRSDLYSLGLVLFRMLTGTLPFRADTPQELMLQRLTVQPMSLAQAAPARAFPEALESALHTVLSIKPGDRQPSAAAFAREITAALGVPLSAATPPGPATLPPTVIAPAGAGAGQATPASAAGALTT